MTQKQKQKLVLLTGVPACGILVLAVLWSFGSIGPARPSVSPTFSVMMQSNDDLVRRGALTERNAQARRSSKSSTRDARELSWNDDEESRLRYALEIIGEDGKPIVGAKIKYYARPSFQLSDDEGDLLQSTTPDEATSDAEGLSTIASRRGTQFDVVIEADGYASRRVRLHDAGKKRVRMEKNAVVSGRVENEAHEPLVGLDIELIHDGAHSEFTTTDVRGEYRFDAVTPNHVVVQIRNAAYESVSKFASVEAGERIRRDFTLKPGARLEVIVTGPTHEVVAGALVDLIETNANQTVGRLITNSHGAVRFDALKEGNEYVLACRAKGVGIARKLVTAAPDMSTAIPVRRERVVLGGEWTYDGVVKTPDGSPVPGAKIVFRSDSLSSLDSSRDQIVVEADESGRFHVNGLLLDSSYSAFVYHSQFAVQTVPVVTPESDGASKEANGENGETGEAKESTPAPIVIARRSEISGSVVDENGAEVANALVFVTIKSLPQGSSGSILVGRTDASGKYSFANLPPGDVSIQAITLQQGKSVEPKDLKLVEDEKRSEIIRVAR